MSILRLDRCNFDFIPETLQQIQIVMGYGFDQPQNLRIRGTELKEFPTLFLMFKKLDIIVLNNNQLYRLPKLFSGFQKLSSLNLSHNNFQNVPSCLKFCGALQHLDMSDNNIVTFPKHLSRLKNLSNLSLKNNDICELPGNFETHCLQILNLEGNSIEEVPKDFFDNTSIVLVSFAKNNIKTFPFISNSGLQHLSVADNPILHIDAKVLTNLTSFNYIKTEVLGLLNFPKDSKIKNLGVACEESLSDKVEVSDDIKLLVVNDKVVVDKKERSARQRGIKVYKDYQKVVSFNICSRNVCRRIIFPELMQKP